LFFFCFFLVRPLDFLALFFVPRATRRSARVSAASIFRSSLARAPSPISVSPARGSGLVTGFGGEGHPTLNFVLLPSDGSGRCCSGKGFVFFFCMSSSLGRISLSAPSDFSFFSSLLGSELFLPVRRSWRSCCCHV
jgi:hypothetical protein